MSDQVTQIEEMFLRGGSLFECRVPPFVDEFAGSECGHEQDYSIDADQVEWREAHGTLTSIFLPCRCSFTSTGEAARKRVGGGRRRTNAVSLRVQVKRGM